MNLHMVRTFVSWFFLLNIMSESHPCYWVYQFIFFFFHSKIAFHRTSIHHVFIRFLIDGNLCCFHLGAILNKAALSIFPGSASCWVRCALFENPLCAPVMREVRQGYGGCDWCGSLPETQRVPFLDSSVGADLPPTLENECPCKLESPQVHFQCFQLHKRDCRIPAAIAVVFPSSSQLPTPIQVDSYQLLSIMLLSLNIDE